MNQTTFTSWLVFLWILMAALPSYCYSQELLPLQGSITKKMSIDEARKNAFHKMPKRFKAYKEARLDPDLIQNLQAKIEKIQCLEDRRISVLSDGSYVVFHFGQTRAYVYSSQGKLLKVGVADRPQPRNILTAENYYPVKTANYLYPYGNLVIVAYSPAPFEDYLFNAKGELLSYCRETQCFAPNGKLLQTRTIDNGCP